MRMTHGSKFDPAKQGRSIVPDLNGPVAVLDSNHVRRRQFSTFLLFLHCRNLLSFHLSLFHSFFSHFSFL